MKATRSPVAAWSALRLPLSAVLLIGSIYFVLPERVVLAQGSPGGCTWSEPVNLSESPDYDTTFGQIIGDPFGRVHAFWVELPVQEAPGSAGVYVAYRVWDGAAWSPVAEILAGPAGFAVLYDVAISPSGDRIYLLWRNASHLYVSSAPLAGAVDPHLWRSTSVAYGTEASGVARMAIDADDNIHLISISESRSVRHNVSSDEGLSWGTPTNIWAAPSLDRAVDYPALIIDARGTYHAAWQENLGAEQDWAAYAIGYSQSTDAGATWTSPIEWESTPRGYANPTLFEDSQGTLHLFWNGASGTLDGRYYAWSEDSGSSWSEVQQLTGGYYGGGRSGPPRIVEDSAGTLHVMHSVEMVSASGDTRVVTAYLAGHTWSPPAMIEDRHGGDMPAMAVSSGNRLHVLLWTQVQPAEILYSTCELQTPRLAPLPTPARVSAPSVTPPVEQLTTDVPAIPTWTPTAKAIRSGREFGDAQPAEAGSAIFPVLASSIASGVLVVSVVGYSLLRRRRS